MKKLWMLVVFLGAGVQLKAQETTAYYLNEREIAPQSFNFLNPADIDSVRFSVDVTTGDSTFVAYTQRVDKLLTYDELLEYFFIEPSARDLPVDMTAYIGVENPEKLVFSSDMINSVKVVNTHYLNTMRIYLGGFRHWDTSSEVGRIMLGISKKYNNIESQMLIRR